MPFQLRSKQILLTYSQVDDATLHEFLSRKEAHFEHISGNVRTPAIYRCGKELHEDGGNHFHVFVAWETPISTRNQHIFDYGTSHPNIQPIRRTPEKAFDYAGKDDDVIYEYGERPGESGTLRDGHNRLWSDAISKPTRDEFLQCIREGAARDYVLYFNAIERFADRHYAPAKPVYVSPPTLTHGFPGMDDWIEQSRIGRDDRRGRVKSLILWGPSRTGKTLWARTLGRYVCVALRRHQPK